MHEDRCICLFVSMYVCMHACRCIHMYLHTYDTYIHRFHRRSCIQCNHYFTVLSVPVVTMALSALPSLCLIYMYMKRDHNTTARSSDVAASAEVVEKGDTRDKEGEERRNTKSKERKDMKEQNMEDDDDDDDHFHHFHIHRVPLNVAVSLRDHYR